MTSQQRRFSKHHRRPRAETVRPTLKTLPLAVALCFCAPLWADTINPGTVAGLPTGGTVAPNEGVVSHQLTSSQLTLTQSTQRAVINWESFNIDAGKTVQFIQPNANAAVLNRVVGSANMSQIYGSLSANGTVVLMNPNGVYFHQGANINVGSLIVTSGRIDSSQFMTEGPITIQDAISGSITNEGSITAENAGLVALVAPSVVNKGAIVATGGRIALSGADRATVSLNGGLFELTVPSGALGTNASITNASDGPDLPGRLEGKTIFMTTGDAANLLSGVINLQGVQQASSAIVVDGNTVVLKSDLVAPSVTGSSNAIEVQAGGSIQDAVNIAKVGTLGNGATIDVRAGTYTEPINSANESLVTLNKANLTLTGHDGAKLAVADLARVNGIKIEANNVTVEGMEISGPVTSSYRSYNWGNNVSRGIFVGENATGFSLRNNNIHDLRNGILINGKNGTGNVVTGNRIENTKSGISVQYTGGAGIDISNNREGSIGNEWGLNLNLNTYSSQSLKPEAPDLTWQQHLLDLRAANNGWSVQDQGFKSSNRTSVNVSSTGLADSQTNQGSWLSPLNTISSGINAVVAGGKVNVNAGTYAESVSITKALTLEGAGAGQSIIDPVSGDAVAVSGTIGANATVLIDGFTFRDAGSAGVSVASGTTLGQLTVQNSDFLNNGKYGFFVNGLSEAGVPGLANVSLLNSTFTGNGASSSTATSLGQGGINLNYYNGNLTLRGLTITGDGEVMGLQMRGYHNATTNAVYDAGTVVFDDVTFNGSYLRPSGSAGTWNPGGPGYAIHLLEYGSVTNVSFNNVKIEPTVGHGMFLEGLSSTLNIGNTRFAMPNRAIVGTVTPTYSMNIVLGSNDQNNVKTNVDATRATFTGASSGFDIEDRVGHALDDTRLGLATWNAGNLYVTQTSGSVQRAIDAASAGNTVNVAAGTYGGFKVNVAGLTVLGDRGDMTQAGAGANAPLINTCTAWGGSVCSSVLIDAAGVTVSGFNISNANGPYGVQIGVIGGARANNATLSYNRIHGVYGVNSGDGIRAVSVEPADDVTIKYNLIEDIRPTNAAAGSSGKSVAGIFLRSAGGAFSKTLIEDNLLRNISISAATGINGAKGIWVGGSAGSASVAELTIRRNQISGVQSNLGAEGILVNHGKNSTGTTSDLLISGNTISDVVGAASSHGIELSGATPNAQVRENDVNLATSTAANTAGVYIDAGANANSSASSIKVSGNSLTGTGYGVDVAGNATVNASGNWWGSNSESAVAARTRGSVDFSPFLVSGTDTASSLAGFQGDATQVRVTTLGAQSGTTGRVKEGVEVAGVGGTVNVAAGSYAEDLQLSTRANLLFDDVSLVGLTMTAGATGSGIGGRLTATGNGGLVFNGDLKLLADTTLATEGRDIALRGAVQNNATTAYGLTLATNAGNGNNRGDVTLRSGGADGNALGQLNVTARNFTLDNTLWVRGYAIDAKGDVALSNSTLKATAAGVTSSLTAGGNVTGSTTSAGAVVLNSDGNVAANVAAGGAATVSGRNVSGAISGSSVTATAQQVLDAAVTAGSGATLNGREIRGSVTASTLTARADTTMNLALNVTDADLYAGTRADVSGRAGRVVVESKNSYFSGSFPAVEGKGTGVPFINGVPQRDEQKVPPAAVIVRPPVIVLPPLPPLAPPPPPAPVTSYASADLPSLPPTAAGAPGGTGGGTSPAATGGTGNSGGSGNGAGTGSSSTGGGNGTTGNGSTSSSGGASEGGGSSSTGSTSSGGGGSSSGGATGGGGSGRVAVAAASGPRQVTVTRNAPGKAAGDSLDRGQGVEVDLSPGR